MASAVSVRKIRKAYFTGLVPLTGDELRKPVVGRGWSMQMGVRPDKCCDDYDPTKPEIVIYARDLNRAEAALDLFLGSLEFFSGPWGARMQLVPEDDNERRDVGHPLGDRKVGFSAANFDLAAFLAKKASSNRRFAYAIALYGVSCHNHVNDPMDLDPVNYPYQSRSETHRDQVRFAYAIIAAYAVVEQLKLIPAAESFDKGNWRPEKRAALEAKLRSANVDLAELVVWHIRGGKTRLEISRPPKIVKMCPWSHWLIRDGEVEIVDAIADLRALRSHVAAHDIKNQAKNLSVHDVVNAQTVARILILAATGFTAARIKQLIATRKTPRSYRERKMHRVDRSIARRALRKTPEIVQI
jgi:hypothetical protein